MRKREADAVKPAPLCATLWHRGSVVDRNYLLDDIAFVVAAVPIGLFGIDAVGLVPELEPSGFADAGTGTAVVVVLVVAVDDKSEEDIHSIIK